MSRSNQTPFLAAALSAVVFAATPALSQPAATTSGQGAGATGQMSASNAANSGGTGTTKGGGNASSDAKNDAKYIIDIAQTNLAEIATGKLALEKAASDDTKKYAQKMIDEHTKALDEVQALASKKGVTLPTEPKALHKTEAAALSALSGKAFDNRYRSHAGVGDHERTAKLLQKIQSDSKDPDVKALAAKMMPTVQQHLTMARDMTGKKS